jgi:hypothetical protein
MATIYRKTAKGLTEIETRAQRLPPRLRSALILVDGRRSDDELRKLILQQPEETLNTLAGQGFIEVIGITQDLPMPRPQVGTAATRQPAATTAAASPGVAVAVPPATTAPPVSAQDFSAARAQAVRAFTDLVGPMAEALAIKMERSRSLDELRPLVMTAQTIIGNARGGQAAASYGSKFLGSPLT